MALLQVLWDRWIGACLQHHTLIQLLCLGGFEDPQAIPWLKFVAICAGTLTDVSSLAQNWPRKVCVCVVTCRI